MVGRLEKCGEVFEFSLGQFDRFFCVVIDEREKSFGEAGEVPLGDAGLVLISVAALLIDVAEFPGGIKVVHESAGTVVNGFAGEAHVVGVHDSVDEAHAHPLRNEFRLAGDDLLKKSEGTGSPGIVATIGVFDQGLQALKITACGKELRGANAEMRTGDAGKDASFFGSLAEDQLPAGNGGEGAGGGDAHRVHCFRDKIFAEDGTKSGAAIALAGKGGRSGPFELNVLAADLAEQDGAAVTELRREAAELVAGVGHCERFGSFGNGITRKDGETFFAAKKLRIDSEC